jgi:hypothetical protein
MYRIALAAVKLEDVFKSTQENMNEAPDSKRLLAMLLGLAACVLLIVAVQYRRKRQITPKPLNNHGKLQREVLRRLPIRGAEMKQLRILAERQQCSSPLVLLLCPSLLAKGLQDRGANADRKVLARVARKLGPART